MRPCPEPGRIEWDGGVGMRALGRRLAVYLLAAWVAITVSFLLPRAVPGNPVAGAIARAQSSGICNVYCIKAIEAQLGFNVHTSIWVQYAQYLGNLFHGNLGFSWSENAPVTSSHRLVSAMDAGTPGRRNHHQLRRRHSDRRRHGLATRFLL